MGVADADGEALQGPILGIEEACAEVRCSAAIYDRDTDEVRAFLQGKAPGDSVVDDGLAIAVDIDNLLPIDPPDGCCIGADGQADILHFLCGVDRGDGPEEDVRGWLAQSAGELEEVDVVVLRINGVPCELGIPDGYLIAIMRDDCELARKILFPDFGLYGCLREAGGVDRLQDDPTLDEAVWRWRFVCPGGLSQRGRWYWSCDRRGWGHLREGK